MGMQTTVLLSLQYPFKQTRSDVSGFVITTVVPVAYAILQLDRRWCVCHCSRPGLLPVHLTLLVSRGPTQAAMNSVHWGRTPSSQVTVPAMSHWRNPNIPGLFAMSCSRCSRLALCCSSTFFESIKGWPQEGSRRLVTWAELNVIEPVKEIYACDGRAHS